MHALVAVLALSFASWAIGLRTGRRLVALRRLEERQWLERAERLEERPPLSPRMRAIIAAELGMAPTAPAPWAARHFPCPPFTAETTCIETATHSN